MREEGDMNMTEDMVREIAREEMANVLAAWVTSPSRRVN
jgi:hypothetical protein